MVLTRCLHKTIMPSVHREKVSIWKSNRAFLMKYLIGACGLKLNDPVIISDAFDYL